MLHLNVYTWWRTWWRTQRSYHITCSRWSHRKWLHMWVFSNMTSCCWHCQWFFKNLCIIRFKVNCYIILWLMILNSGFWPDWSTKNMWSGKTHWLLVWKLQATCTLETTIRKKDLSYLILKCKKACLKLKTIMFSSLGWPCECFLLHTNALLRCSSQS